MMKKKLLIVGLLLFSTFSFSQEKTEKHTQRIISEILKTKQEIIKTLNFPEDSIIFLTFWDFDGTIMKGDCSEGLENEKTKEVIYKGLAQIEIENGYSSVYPINEGSKKFFNDYYHMSETVGNWLALPYLIQIFRGSNLNDVFSLAEKHFEYVLSKYFFKSSITTINTLESNGIQCHIMSASPDIFVDAAASSIGIPKERFNGIEVQIENEKITEKLIYPVTWGEGKPEKLKNIVNGLELQNPNKIVIVLAAFGNSYSTDGPFMKDVALQKLPAGKPTTVMINGGNVPNEYKDIFVLVKQSEIVGVSKFDK